MLLTVIVIMASLHTLIFLTFGFYFIAFTRAVFEELPTDVNFIYNAQMKDTYVFMAKSGHSECNHCHLTVEAYNHEEVLAVGVDAISGDSYIVLFENGNKIGAYFSSNEGPLDISCTEYKSFWMTWFQGHIQAGVGTAIGQNVEWDFIHPALEGIPFPMSRIITESDIDIPKDNAWANRCFLKASHPVRNNKFAVIETKRQWKVTGEMLDALFDGDNSSCIQLPSYPVVTLKTMVPFRNRNQGVSLTIVVADYPDEIYIYVYYRDANDEQTESFEGNFRLCEMSSRNQTATTEAVTLICEFSQYLFIKVFAEHGSPKLCEMIYP